MPQVNVISGDIERGAWRFTDARGGCSIHRTTQADWFRPVFIDFQRQVVRIEELSRSRFDELAHGEPWALSGRGFQGWLMRLVDAEANRDVGFTARLADGREFTAMTDSRTWKKLRLAVQDRPDRFRAMN